jgi:hypothetical protein
MERAVARFASSIAKLAESTGSGDDDGGRCRIRTGDPAVRIFTTGYGVAWFLGSAGLGFLYNRSLSALIAFSIVVELAAVPFSLAIRLAPSHSAER